VSFKNNPSKLDEMKNFISNNLIDFSWNAYGERFVDFLKNTHEI
jgi:hypothetical protein